MLRDRALMAMNGEARGLSKKDQSRRESLIEKLRLQHVGHAGS